MTTPTASPQPQVPDASIKPTTWAMFCHLSALLGYVVGGIAAPVAPLILWLIKKDSIPEVADQGKEALNFNITVVLVELVIAGVAMLGGFNQFFLAMYALLVVVAFHVGFVIRAAIQSNGGKRYRYPLTLRLVR